MKKHVKAKHEEGPREKEEDNVSPPRKTSKTENEIVDEDAMEETPKEEKEVIEARKEEVVLELRRRIYDQNQRLYNLEQEKENLKQEN